MKKPDFTPKGIVPALITPLTGNGDIHEKSLRQLIHHVIKGGVHGIFVSGTTGEFYGLSHQQKQNLFQLAIDEADAKVPVYAGTAGITTRECIQLTQIAQDCGVDAVSILTPMFIVPNQDQLYQHYAAIASETDLPILLYNNVTKTGVNITPVTVERLADINNIVGIKDSSGDFTLTAEYIRHTRDKNFHVLCGRDTLIHACLCYGGAGAIAACANVAPRLVADIYDKYVDGDIAGSLEAQYILAPLRLAFTLGTFPVVIKEALELIGVQAGECLAPVGQMTNDERMALRKILKDMELLTD